MDENMKNDRPNRLEHNFSQTSHKRLQGSGKSSLRQQCQHRQATGPVWLTSNMTWILIKECSVNLSHANFGHKRHMNISSNLNQVIMFKFNYAYQITFQWGIYLNISKKKTWKAQQNFNCQGWFTEYKQYNFIQPLLTSTIKHTCYLTNRNAYQVKQLFRLLRIIHHHKHIPCLIRKHKRWLHRLAVYTGSSWWNCSATLFIINIPGIVFAL